MCPHLHVSLPIQRLTPSIPVVTGEQITNQDTLRRNDARRVRQQSEIYQSEKMGGKYEAKEEEKDPRSTVPSHADPARVVPTQLQPCRSIPTPCPLLT